MSDAATPAVVPDAQRVIKQVTEVVRAADRAFESSGGSSRHWVREQFIPCLEDAGLRIVPAAYIERLEAERDALLAAVTAAYFLLNSDQCTHGDGDWHYPACRVCNLRSAFDALPPDVRDRLASMTYAERVIHGE